MFFLNYQLKSVFLECQLDYAFEGLRLQLGYRWDCVLQPSRIERFEPCNIAFFRKIRKERGENFKKLPNRLPFFFFAWSLNAIEGFADNVMVIHLENMTISPTQTIIKFKNYIKMSCSVSIYRIHWTSSSWLDSMAAKYALRLSDREV